jgi:hypothetical protein
MSATTGRCCRGGCHSSAPNRSQRSRCCAGRGMWRPAHARLRGLLECVATILWIAQGPEDAPHRFAVGRSPFQRLLGQSGGARSTTEPSATCPRSPTRAPTAPRLTGGTTTSAASMHRRPRSRRTYGTTSSGCRATMPSRCPSGRVAAGAARGVRAVPCREGIRHRHFRTRRAVWRGGCCAARWWPQDGLVVFARCLRDHPPVRERTLWSGLEADGSWPHSPSAMTGLADAPRAVASAERRSGACRGAVGAKPHRLK